MRANIRLLLKTAAFSCLAAASTALVACGSDDAEPAANGGAGGQGGAGATAGSTSGGSTSGGSTSGGSSSGGAGGSSSSLVNVPFMVQDLVTRAGLPDVRACLHEAMPERCATTDGAGTAFLMVPENENFAVTLVLADYQSSLNIASAESVELALTGDLVLLLTQTAVVDGLLAQVNQTWDRGGKGAVAGAFDSAGVTPSLMPVSGNEPFYLVGTTVSTSTTGLPDAGFAGIANVDPGTYTLTTSHDTKTCAVRGWAKTNPNEQEVPIIAGFLTGLLASQCN